MRIELLCKIVDNYGDAGVCARLARQLADEYAGQIRLWTDKPELVNRFIAHPSVEILHWPETFPALSDIGAMVIEAFACGTPPELITAMKAAATPPLWVNLDYLSAEEWVDGCHGQISLHPSGLKQIFVFPGFTEKTGGLLRERSLIGDRDHFDPAPFWQKLGVPVRDDELRLSLFCYPTAPIQDLIDGLGALDRPVRILYPSGMLEPPQTPSGVVLHPFPFLSQTDYDKLLWASDLNFVRGEDSFSRANWAAKPLIWHIYKQDDAAHFRKLEAYLTRLTPFLSPKCAETLALVHEVWNLPARSSSALWLRLFADLPELTAATKEWARHLAAQKDLARQLMELTEGQKGSQS